MNWKEYMDLVGKITKGEYKETPYDDEHMVQYTKLNEVRIKRWLKNPDILDKDLIQQLNNLPEKQEWILILEPWCGDGAHIAPFIHLMAQHSDKINLTLQLRDSEDSIIEQYLTNGSRSIPKLIVRDENGKDLFTWGARPKAAQDHFEELKNTNMTPEERKAALQVWYNKDKGESIQREFAGILSSIQQQV